MFPSDFVTKAKELLDLFQARKLTLATAESCTGGLIAALLTEVPGSSGVFEHGFVTYSNQAKMELLKVDKTLLDEHGAVSEEIAIAMAKGAKSEAETRLALSVTGIAGPGGAQPGKPVGTVWIAVAAGKKIITERNQFGGGRADVRMATVKRALEMLKEAVTPFSVSL